MTSQEVGEDLVLLAERAVEALKGARLGVRNAETSKDVIDDSVLVGQGPDPTRRTDSQLMPPPEVLYKSTEKHHSSMASSKRDYEGSQTQFFHLRPNVNDRLVSAVVESENDMTLTQRKPDSQGSFAPLCSHGDRPGLPWNTYEANSAIETQCNLDEDSSYLVGRNSYASSKYNAPSSTPSQLGPFALKRNSYDSTGIPRYPFYGNSSQPAPLPLGPRVESAYTIHDASRSSQTGAGIHDQTHFVIKDGKYMSPKYMKGVPVAKIQEGGQYWRQSWVTIGQWIKGSEQLWVKETVKFWKAYRIHPNQLLSIDYYDELGLCSAGIPRLLQQTLEDLEAAGVPDPIQWLRERLGELIVENSKDVEKNFALKAVLKRFRVHDRAFRPYHRKNKTRYNVAQSISSKRAHVEGFESSPRPQKKHVYATSNDHETVSRVPQNHPTMPDQLPIASKILKQNDSEPSADGALGSRDEVVRQDDQGFPGPPNKNLIFDVNSVTCGLQSLKGNTTRMHFDALAGKIQPMDLEQKELLGYKYPALNIIIRTVASLNVIEENVVKIHRFTEVPMTVGFRDTKECMRFIATIYRCDERVRLIGVDPAQLNKLDFSF